MSNRAVSPSALCPQGPTQEGDFSKLLNNPITATPSELHGKCVCKGSDSKRAVPL